ncbi:hypothetical protein PSTT_03691 [Puccinia striiformis]|uniref:DUF6589 domain-containing protein n=1 Tax=Puccinia striiformis TaxID=27350 RepID=A0A2S4VVL6_9BASI|nr:hypothetical protein PSTT_03691 [Puccinia striiformis]
MNAPFLWDYTFNKDDPTTESIPVIPTEAWNQAIKKCYEAYCSPAARRKAAQLKCPKLSNLLIRIKDFLTGVEANRAMKAGDIGRLLRVWKMWSIMTQSLPGLTHYSAYLPRLVLLITRILPPSLAKLIRHTLLLSPSGRPSHFVAKDFHLETNTIGSSSFSITQESALRSKDSKTYSHQTSR